MNNLLPVLVSVAPCVMSFRGAVGQTLLYEETFPSPGVAGGHAVSVARWANSIPNIPARLFQMSGADGAVYAFQANEYVPITTAFYSSPASRTTGWGTRSHS